MEKICVACTGCSWYIRVMLLWEAQLRCWRWLRHDCRAQGRMTYFSNSLTSLNTAHATDFFPSGISEIFTESGCMWGNVSVLIAIELYWCTNESVIKNFHAALYMQRLWGTKSKVSWKDLSPADICFFVTFCKLFVTYLRNFVCLDVDSLRFDSSTTLPFSKSNG